MTIAFRGLNIKVTDQGHGLGLARVVTRAVWPRSSICGSFSLVLHLLCVWLTWTRSSWRRSSVCRCRTATRRAARSSSSCWRPPSGWRCPGILTGCRRAPADHHTVAQVGAELPTSADNMSLLAFAAERRCCWAAAAVDQYRMRRADDIDRQQQPVARCGSSR